MIAGCSRFRSATEKKTAQIVIEKYQAKFGKEYPYEVSKQVLKEVNENNDHNRMLDLQGQSLKNAQIIVKEKIENLERIARAKKFSGSISDGSDSQDMIFLFYSKDLKDKLNDYIIKTLKRECHLIKDKDCLVVRIAGYI